jgi:hypothetical protein
MLSINKQPTIARLILARETKIKFIRMNGPWSGIIRHLHVLWAKRR